MELKEDKIKRLTNSVSLIDSKENKIMFYTPSVPQASGGVGVLYEHAKTLKDLGYNVSLIYEPTFHIVEEGKDKGKEKETPFIKPEWLGEEYTSLPHVRLTKQSVFSPEDILIIPEGLTDFMQKTKDFPCVRVVLCQSYLYVLGSLMPGMNWTAFNIKDVIVVTPTLQDYIENVFGKGNFDIKLCRPSIDEKIFKSPTKPKKPIIAISGRDRYMSTNIIKHFYSTYPQYRWISFKEMNDLTREEFSEALQDSALGVWIDRVAGFGTFPIECAKTETPFIGLVPDIIPEYAKDKSGYWTNNFLSIPHMIAEYMKFWLEDKIPQEDLDGLAELAKLYTKSEEEINIKAIYSEYLTKRKDEILSVIEKIKTEE